MGVIEKLMGCAGFDWDDGNLLKNWRKHGVSVAECEQVFFNRPLLAKPDVLHSASETRYYLLGRTDSGRRLFVVFTIRQDLIRVVSARDMNRNERRSYEKYGKEAEKDSQA